MNKTKFTYDDTVQVRATADVQLRPGDKASVVAVYESRPGPYFKKFPEGVVYMIEFEDGTAIEIHEDDLMAASFP